MKTGLMRKLQHTRTVLSFIAFVVANSALSLFATVSVWAQFEINPDHYEFRDAEPFSQARNVSKTASTRYDASLTLPYPVQWNGTSLPAGTYSVSLVSDGKIGQARLIGKSRALELKGLAREADHSRKDDALIVAFTGNTHRLAAIHISALDLVFDSSLLARNLRGTESLVMDSVVLISVNREK